MFIPFVKGLIQGCHANWTFHIYVYIYIYRCSMCFIDDLSVVKSHQGPGPQRKELLDGLADMRRPGVPNAEAEDPPKTIGKP